MKVIGVVDTTFARYDMAASAIAELRKHTSQFKLVTATVPGMKDLPVACKRLIEKEKCDIVIALAMPGPKPQDKVCADQASHGLINAMLMTSTHILEVFVFEDEAKDDKELAFLADSRSRGHALNAYYMLYAPDKMKRRAGQGIRQGFENAGAVRG